jgi:hypothetical protein
MPVKVLRESPLYLDLSLFSIKTIFLIGRMNGGEGFTPGRLQRILSFRQAEGARHCAAANIAFRADLKRDRSAHANATVNQSGRRRGPCQACNCSITIADNDECMLFHHNLSAI